jgi:hypothetical protein
MEAFGLSDPPHPSREAISQSDPNISGFKSQHPFNQSSFRKGDGHNTYYRDFPYGVFVVFEGLYMFELGTIATGGRMIPLGNLSFSKGTLVEWMLGLEP